MKRDEQLQQLLNKVKSQDQVVSNLESKLREKSAKIATHQEEINDLKTQAQLSSNFSRQEKVISDLKKKLSEKEGEISLMKGLVKNFQQEKRLKFPPIKNHSSRSKYSISEFSRPNHTESQDKTFSQQSEYLNHSHQNSEIQPEDPQEPQEPQGPQEPQNQTPEAPKVEVQESKSIQMSPRAKQPEESKKSPSKSPSKSPAKPNKQPPQQTNDNKQAKRSPSKPRKPK